MTLNEIASLAQSGVLSALAIILFYRFPSIWASLLDFIERIQKFGAEQAAIERESRVRLAEKTAASLADLRLAVDELRKAAQTFCKYKV